MHKSKQKRARTGHESRTAEDYLKEDDDSDSNHDEEEEEEKDDGHCLCQKAAFGGCTCEDGWDAALEIDAELPSHWLNTGNAT